MSLHLTPRTFVRDAFLVKFPGGDYLAVLHQEPDRPWKLEARFRGVDGAMTHTILPTSPDADAAELTKVGYEAATKIAEAERRRYDGHRRIKVVHKRINAGGKQLLAFLSDYLGVKP